MVFAVLNYNVQVTLASALDVRITVTLISALFGCVF